MKKQRADIFVGLDVGRESMEAVWVDDEGNRVNSLSFSNDNAGYELFLSELTQRPKRRTTLNSGG